MREYIARAGMDDAWLCRCGNSPGGDGFVPVHRGREIDPSSARWRGHYCCLTCGLLITWPTREIIGRIDFADLTLCASAPCPKRRRRPSLPPRSRRVRVSDAERDGPALVSPVDLPLHGDTTGLRAEIDRCVARSGRHITTVQTRSEG